MPEIVPERASPPTGSPDLSRVTPWLTAAEAAQRAKVGSKAIYDAVRGGHLRAARIGGRRQLRFKTAWVDDWIEAMTEVVDVHSRHALRVAK